MIKSGAHFAYVIFAPAAGFIIASLNLFTVYVFVKKIRLHSFCLILIVNICLCDTFVNLFSNLFYVYNLLHHSLSWSSGDLACRLFRTVTMAANVAQIFSLCLINADRLRRLTNIKVTQWTKRRGIRVLIITWIATASLTVPRMFLFETRTIKKTSPDSNVTLIVDIICKPTDLHGTWNVVSICLLFVLVYVLPACYVLYSSMRAQVFMWHHRKRIHLANSSSRGLRMNHALSMTFNLTAGFFLAVWSPFFILSVLDLTDNILGRKDLKSLNFTLRCTLVVIGGLKPILYVICLEKFRNAIQFKRFFTCDRVGTGEFTSSETTEQQQTTQLESLKTVSSETTMVQCFAYRPLSGVKNGVSNK